MLIKVTKWEKGDEQRVLLINTNEISSADVQCYRHRGKEVCRTRIYFQDASYMEVLESLDRLLCLEREASAGPPLPPAIQLSRGEVAVN